MSTRKLTPSETVELMRTFRKARLQRLRQELQIHERLPTVALHQRLRWRFGTVNKHVRSDSSNV